MTPRARLHAAMLRIEQDRSLFDALPSTHTGTLGEIEGIAHELAHQLDHGRNFEHRLARRGVTDAQANDREASTLRIEVAALARLGVKVSLRSLWRDAGWRGARPELARRLDARERKCVRAFVRIVREAMP